MLVSGYLGHFIQSTNGVISGFYIRKHRYNYKNQQLIFVRSAKAWEILVEKFELGDFIYITTHENVLNKSAAKKASKTKPKVIEVTAIQVGDIVL